MMTVLLFQPQIFISSVFRGIYMTPTLGLNRDYRYRYGYLELCWGNGIALHPQYQCSDPLKSKGQIY